MPQPELISVRATAELIGVSKWTVYRMIEAGHLDAVRATPVGRSRLLIDRHQVEALLVSVRQHSA